MKQLSLRFYGDPVLREKGKPIDVFDDELREFADAMIETMTRERGIGLAAPQVGESVRLIVALEMDDADDDDARPVVLVNPKVVEQSKETWLFEEGCLSIPGITASVIRPREVKIEYQDIDGNNRMLRSDKLFGRILHHEIDHINGVLFIDYLSTAQKSILKNKLKQISQRF